MSAAAKLPPEREGYRFWSDQELAHLAVLSSTARVVSDIAEQLGRTVNAVRLILRKRGLTPFSVRRLPVAKRFEHYFVPEPNSGCWLWIGSADERGYGQIRVSKTLIMQATHISLEIAGRPLPSGLFACHSCDTPACVNPDHLFAGTQIDNIQDCMRKGRHSAPPKSTVGRGIKLICKRGHSRSGLIPGSNCMECSKHQKRARRAARRAMGLPRQ